MPRVIDSFYKYGNESLKVCDPKTLFTWRVIQEF